MARVLIVAPSDPTPELGRTILWRSDIERVIASDPQSAFEAAISLRPNLAVMDGSDGKATVALIERLRQEPLTRGASVAVLSRGASGADEEALRRAGANVVLRGPVDPRLWDSRLEELLDLPRRREARIPVRFGVWSRSAPGTEALEGVGLNISVRGMLLETPEPVDVGINLVLALALPGESEPLNAVGLVVQMMGASGGGRPRSRIEFLLLRGDARERIRAFIEAELGTA
jgi:CheY-like chemotaxis protein